MAGYNNFTNYMDAIGLGGRLDYDYQSPDNVRHDVGRMLDRSCMMFEWHGLPGSIPALQLEKILQCQGYAIIGKVNGKPYACYGGLGGELDEYYRPTLAMVSIPYFDFAATWHIGKDCVVMRNDTMQQGLLPLYAKYCHILDACDISLVMALVNSRAQTYISAESDKAIASAQQFIDNLAKGKLSVIADEALFDSLKIHDAGKGQGTLQEIRETIQYVRASLYNEIGLATNYLNKKEHVSRAEVELNTDYLYPLIDNMYKCRKDGAGEVAALLGLEWECEYNSSWDYRIYNGEPVTTKGAGDGAGEIGAVEDTTEIEEAGGVEDGTDELRQEEPEDILGTTEDSPGT